MVSYCPKCNEKITTKTKFCPNCGAPLSGDSRAGNALAIAAFSCAMASLALFWVPVFDAILALFAVGLGVFAIARKPPITGTARILSWVAIGFGGAYFLISIFTGLVCI